MTDENEEVQKKEAILPIYLDSTMLDAFKSCPRKFYYEFCMGLRLRDKSVDLHAGGAFASGLQAFYNAYYGGMLFDNALLEGLRAYLKAWGPDYVAPEKSPKNQVAMWAAIESYLETYPPQTDEMQPYFINGSPGIETTFSVPLLPEDGFPLHPVSGEPFLYSGRLDFIGLRGDKFAIRDEKTTRSFAENWHEMWDLRAQFLGYCWALKQFDYPVREVTVRGIAILKSEIRHQEARVFYPQHMLDRWYFQLKRDVNRLANCWKDGYFDYNFGSSCTMYKGCIFKDLCKVKNDEGYFDNYIVKRWNPLLPNPEEDEVKEKQEAA